MLGSEEVLERGSPTAREGRRSISRMGIMEIRTKVVAMVMRIRMPRFFTSAHSVSKLCTTELMDVSGSEL